MLPPRRPTTTIHDGVLGCQCCVFPVVDGIPVLHLHPASNAAREQIEAGTPELALRAMVGLDDEAQAERFEAAIASPTSTYKDIVEVAGSWLRGRLLSLSLLRPDLHRRQTPSSARRRHRAALRRAGTRHLRRIGTPDARAGGSVSKPAPVLADLFFPKIWLARRFTAPGACRSAATATRAMPFARGSFDYAMCSDAFSSSGRSGSSSARCSAPSTVRPHATVVINHTHNQLAWSPSHGQPLTPAGYRNLFETCAGTRLRRDRALRRRGGGAGARSHPQGLG